MHLSRIMLVDFLNLFCGAVLGEGNSRTVFAMEFDQSKVIKIEKDDGRFQNLIEWKAWNDCKGTVLEKYLAPVHDISANGKVLIMERVMPLPTLSEAKQGASNVLKGVMLPDVLTDYKPENYGILKGQIVCCDYGSILALNHGAVKMKLRKAKFW
jgi:hypothetical protein